MVFLFVSYKAKAREEGDEGRGSLDTWVPLIPEALVCQVSKGHLSVSGETAAEAAAAWPWPLVVCSVVVRQVVLSDVKEEWLSWGTQRKFHSAKTCGVGLGRSSWELCPPSSHSCLLLF